MFYDVFSTDYDKFVNWEGRLAAEIPFITKLLSARGAKTILDSACGTGMHAIRLDQDGFKTFGCDFSPKMVEIANANAQKAKLNITFFQAGFGELSHKSPVIQYDAILCLGNSLPHVTDESHLEKTLADFYQHLPSGGTLLIQNRNFDAVLNTKQRWMEPQAAVDDVSETLFHRFYDFLEDGSIQFNIMITKRPLGGVWNQQVITTRLLPITSTQIVKALEHAGYTSIELFGDLTGAKFDPVTSPNIICVAKK